MPRFVSHETEMEMWFVRHEPRRTTANHGEPRRPSASGSHKKIKMVKLKFIRVLSLIFFSLAFLHADEGLAQQTVPNKSFLVQSPDAKIKVQVLVRNGEAMYNVRYGEELVLQNSMLGLVRVDADFSNGLQ